MYSVMCGLSMRFSVGSVRFGSGAVARVAGRKILYDWDEKKQKEQLSALTLECIY